MEAESGTDKSLSEDPQIIRTAQILEFKVREKALELASAMIVDYADQPFYPECSTALNLLLELRETAEAEARNANNDH